MTTQLVERADKLALDYLYNLNDNELIGLIFTEEELLVAEIEGGARAVSKKAQKQVLTNIRSYIENCVNNEFEYPVKYSQRKGIYRMQAAFPGVQHLKGSVRGVLFKENTFDIDQCNSHIVILTYLMEKYAPSTPILHLKAYSLDREKYIKELVDKGVHKKIAKRLFLKVINKQDRLSKKDKHTTFLDNFDKEIKDIQIALGSLPEFTAFHTMGLPNALGKFMANLLQHWEHRINTKMVEYLQKNNYEIAALMFDGALVYNKKEDCKKDLLQNIEREVETEYPGLGMKWSFKDHSNDITIPIDYEPQGLEGGYANAKMKWEKMGYCKIVQDVCFMRIMESGTTLKYTRNDIKSIAEDFGPYKFIDNWLEDADKRAYQTIGQYPPDVPTPPGIYNTWLPFAAESMEYEEDLDGMAVLLKHFEIMCGDDISYQHFLKWMAYIIQKPSQKNGAIMPIFIGTREGGGKGTLIDILRRMFGERKVLETTCPSRDVFGNFNSQMEFAYLVYLNEMSRREMSGVEEHLKSYITDKYIHINQKHIKTITIQSNHKFICSTNNLSPKQSADQSRRDWYLVCPNTLVGNKEYFSNIRKVLDGNDNAVATLYHYLKKFDFKDFASLPIPKGQYQQDLEADSRKPVVLWCEQWLRSMLELEGDEFWGEDQEVGDLWKNYKDWIHAEFPTHNTMSRGAFSRNLIQLVFKEVYPNFKNEIPPVYRRSNGKTYFVFFKKRMCDFFGISYCKIPQ